MVAVDVASKPTLASYNIRPDNFDPKRPGPPNKLQRAKDRDEAMLAVVDRHSEVVDGKIRTRDFKGAITLLKRTQNMVAHHQSPVPGDGEKALVVRLASACVQIQLCVALSRIGRHAPALQEATRAKEELDDIWALLTGAAMDMAMAEAGGDSNKPHPVLRSHICHPPHWLERAVCCAIQSRLCMAMEMEYLLSNEELQSQRSGVLPPILPVPSPPGSPSSADHETMDLTSLDQETLTEGLTDAGLNVGLPLPPLSEMQQMWQLYEEAVALAAQLLPSTHALKLDAEKAAGSALDRWASAPKVPGESSASFAVEKSRPSVSFAKEAESTSLPLTKAPLPAPPSPVPAEAKAEAKVELKPALRRKSEEVKEATFQLPELEATTSQDEWLSELPSMLLSKGGQKVLSRSNTMPSLQRARDEVITPEEKQHASQSRRNTDSNSHGDWVKRAPPGDVFYRSLPWSFGLPNKSPKNQRRKKKKADTSASLTNQPEMDPFKDWAKEFMHLENMTLFQRKLRTLDGISSLHTDMKIETKRFRQVMQDLEMYGGEEQERLGNNRILYTDAGMKALRIGQQRNEQLRKSAWQTSTYGQKFMEREKQLFGYYGMGKQYEKGIDVKCLRKLLEESVNRTPAGRARKKKEEDERKKQELEEAEQQKRELAQIGFRKQKQKDQKAKASLC